MNPDGLYPCTIDRLDREARARLNDTKPEPTPYDVMLDHLRHTPAHTAAVHEARVICGQCPIQLACLRDNRREPWVKSIVAPPVGRPPQPVPKACAHCDRPMVGQRDKIPDGYVRHMGRGLCMACYSADRRMRRRAA